MEISQNNWTDYLADGPWGLDYMKTETSISSFMIDNIQISISSDQCHRKKHLSFGRYLVL
jgi:hypothetical protein